MNETNQIHETDQINLHPALARLMVGEWNKGAIPQKWDEKVAERIVEHPEEGVESK